MPETKTTTTTAVGAFHAKWTVGNPVPGAPMLQIDAVVVTPTQTVCGIARLTQATNPPLDVQINISGSFIDVTEKNTTHFVNLTTTPTQLVGTPYLQLALVLGTDWKTGTASCRYVCGSTTGQLDNVPVQIETAVAATA